MVTTKITIRMTRATTREIQVKILNVRDALLRVGINMIPAMIPMMKPPIEGERRQVC